MSATIETLRKQHRDVLALLDEVDGRAPLPPARLQALLDVLETDVRDHFTLEEDALFPVLAHHPQIAHGPLAVMEAEHHEFRALLARLAAAMQRATSDRPEAVARMISPLLRAHIDKEDRVLFPMAMRLLSAVERDEVEALAAAHRARGAAPAAKPAPRH